MNAKKHDYIHYFKEENIKDYEWLIPDGDVNGFMKSRIKNMQIGFIIILLSYECIYFVLKYLGIEISPLLGVALAVGGGYLCFKWSFWSLKSKFNKKKEDVYKAFPLWVSTLEILVMTNTITNTFKKSIATCPDAFKAELIEFVNKIELDPANKEYYKEFLRKYKIEDVSEIIMDMYAFNNLDKNEIVYEFEHLNKRLNKISNNIRKGRQKTSLFGIAALNSIPLFTVSIWVLLAAMLINIG